ncbi:hypothetical protein A3A93_03415 [Candidatus Roizmanbacteria bacterium RIFCSPLOWO2_01_FULL_38_12]|uniref:Uncharacterized protein n=1 Tax=Candidatus Roizmanbacteria bacterium RIFCSPLOWO2_01_FULL_38_12 TaxID=1802061 RepID=A0A1F7ISN6_9BACT|nr:MAG: hypothetical protein A2861_01295 [Candidatus Roizmanbacteria bacterium RIFCSPHIGHO2_01_FULL_38_15]OGK35818.1 MAG: hypothetical protein A3F59_03700 [Candidatus Roizmanbacteria bacterium RIFCSPHIGHO2_12_FULL_38_13]OGK46391.1 MAG: hypothetical protein A3A93_03415 [Candidatus Roizmanbacteria bacterium RIFCSPLOWO2_01_FULL_38_12]
MDMIEFYDVKNKKKVQVSASEVEKVTYERKTKSGATQIRYALKAVKDGVKLTKFVSKETWDSIKG